ncbi:MAG: peptide deformylase [Tannerellaceae bacterium]|jgi:peptide deformylase|nr:peptide deformylase [Tannerellaceae bacterium]
MILPVYLYGHPILREEAQEVPLDYPSLTEWVSNMFATMYHAEGVGLAAPQVGLSLRLVVIDGDPLAETYPECKGFRRVMINPVILRSSREEVVLEEGCLSLPGIHEKVPRARQIEVEYTDEHGQGCREVVSDFAARIVQHECEHLNGIVFTDNIPAIRRQLTKGKLNNIAKGNSRCRYKTRCAGR